MSDFCPICLKPVSEKSKGSFIQCDICNHWTHQHRCSGLTQKQFEFYSEFNSENWYCSDCINFNLPFPVDPPVPPTNSVPPGSGMSDELKTLLADLNKVITDFTSDDDVEEDDIEIQFQANSCSYVNCEEFNSIASKTRTNFSAFHLNIASVSKHFDKLGDLLAQLKAYFNFIGITETRSLVDDTFCSCSS